MNKYQEAFDFIVTATNGGDGIKKELNILSELVNKSIPIKPKPLFIPIAYLPYRCPVCRALVNHKKDKFNYCPNCGQKINWSKE